MYIKTYIGRYLWCLKYTEFDICMYQSNIKDGVREPSD